MPIISKFVLLNKVLYLKIFLDFKIYDVQEIITREIYIRQFAERKDAKRFYEVYDASTSSLTQFLQREMMPPNEKRKCASPCGEHRRMGERRQMNVLIIFLDNKYDMPHHSASSQL